MQERDRQRLVRYIPAKATNISETNADRISHQQRPDLSRDGEFYGSQGAEPIYENTPTSLSTQQALDKFSVSTLISIYFNEKALVVELDRNISQNSNLTLQSLPANHVIRTLIRQVPLLVTQATNRDDCALLFSQKIVQLLYKNDTKLAREINLLILEKLCEISKRFFKEFKEWLLYGEDDRKYDVNVSVSLLERGFITVQELDMQMARLVDGGRSSAVTFTCNLVQSCVLSDPPLCSFNAFALSIEALSRLPDDDLVLSTIQAVSSGLGQKMSQLTAVNDKLDSEGLAKVKEQIIAVYKEWIQIYGHPASNERNQLNYVALVSNCIRQADVYLVTRERHGSSYKHHAPVFPCGD